MNVDIKLTLLSLFIICHHINHIIKKEKKKDKDMGRPNQTHAQKKQSKLSTKNHTTRNIGS